MNLTICHRTDRSCAVPCLFTCKRCGCGAASNRSGRAGLEDGREPRRLCDDPRAGVRGYTWVARRRSGESLPSSYRVVAAQSCDEAAGASSSGMTTIVRDPSCWKLRLDSGANSDGRSHAQAYFSGDRDRLGRPCVRNDRDRHGGRSLSNHIHIADQAERAEEHARQAWPAGTGWSTGRAGSDGVLPAHRSQQATSPWRRARRRPCVRSVEVAARPPSGLRHARADR